MTRSSSSLFGPRARRGLVAVVALAAVVLTTFAVRPPSAAADAANGFETLGSIRATRTSFVVRAWPGMPRSTIDAVSNAMGQLAAQGINLSWGPESTSGPEAGEITVRISDQSGCVGNWAGCTATWADGNGVTTKAAVIIHPSMLGSRWERAVVTHELGHAVGLGHFTGTYGGLRQIMYPSVDGSFSNYRAGDANGLRALAGAGVAFGTPFGAFDSATVGDALRLTGWAIDRDAGAGPIDVHAYVDGNIAGAATANTYRPDVGSVYGLGNNHGYDFTVPLPTNGTHNVCVYAINVGVGAGNPQLACRTVTVSGRPVGNLESLTVGLDRVVRASGWILDSNYSDAAVTANLTVDGVTVASAPANTSRPDVSAGLAYYGIRVGPNHGFSLSAPNIAAGAHTVCVTVGAKPLDCRRVDVSPNPTGSIDVVRHELDRVTVFGWALDPDAPATSIPVHIYVDAVGTATTANTARPDVNSALGVPGDHGYTATVAVPPGPHNLCIYAINTGPGGNVALGCQTVVGAGPNPIGSFDLLTAGPDGVVRADGWALDTDAGNGPIDVHVWIDGRWGMAGTANGSRPDVDAAFHHGADHGYSIAFSGIPAGPHQVCAYGINVGAGTNTGLACRTVTVPGGSPFGSVDVVSATGPGKVLLAGWAIDPDVTASIPIHVYVDGAWGGAYMADASRPDVAAAYPGYGAAHGFATTLTMAPGPHQVCTYGINSGVGGHNLIGCRNVTVS